MTDTPSLDTLKVEQLSFDRKNPRLPVNHYDGDEDKVLDYFIRKANLMELIASIGENGFYDAEALLVVKLDDTDKYTVVEGNRRLAALRLLLNPNKAPVKKSAIKEMVDAARFKPEEVPVLIYEKYEDVLDYLGYRHITGVQQWDSLAKATYLKTLYDYHSQEDSIQDNEVYRKVAKVIGSRADYVAKLIRGYYLYKEIADEGFYDIDGLDPERFSFSLLTTALTYSNIAEFVGIKETSEGLSHNRKELKELTHWMFDRVTEGRPRIAESRRLKDFNKVVGNKKALNAFRSGKPLDYALRLTDAPQETFKIALQDIDALVDVAQEQSIYFEANQVDANDIEHITLIARRLLDIRSALNTRREEKEFNL